MTGVRKVYSNAAGQIWACYAATGGACHRPASEESCPHMPDYADRRNAHVCWSMFCAMWLAIAPTVQPYPTRAIVLLLAAIARTERLLAERFPFSSAEDCCPECKYNYNVEFRRLSDKLERQEAWLEVLRLKQQPPRRGETPPGDKRSRFVRCYEMYGRLTGVAARPLIRALP